MSTQTVEDGNEYEVHVEFDPECYEGSFHERATQADECFVVIASSKDEAMEKVESISDYPVMVFNAVYEVA